MKQKVIPVIDHRFRNLFCGTSLFVLAGVVAYLCAFKLCDPDFWWHVKAGEIMLHTRGLIHVDPFAYTRTGLPYHSTHEWLAQIILFVMYHSMGVAGIQVWIPVMIFLSFAAVLSVDLKSVWVTSLIAIWGVNAAHYVFLPRPQLWTYLFLAIDLRLVFYFLELPEESRARRRQVLWAFIAVEVFWVNVHGAAALLGFILAGSLWVDALLRRSLTVRELSWTLAGMLAAFFVSPNTYHNLTYVQNLLNDRTISLIEEWRPRRLGPYLRDIGPLWVVVLVSLVRNKRPRLISVIIVALFGYLSLKAFRHETLFILAAVAVSTYELGRWPAFVRLLDLGLLKPVRALTFYIAVLAALASYTRAQHLAFHQEGYPYGYGVFDFARRAADFLEKENIQGPMFNSYSVGCYLLYRGYPNRKVFFDGRNVDFGYDFMSQAYFAGERPELWKNLDDQYHFSYAIIDYHGIRRETYLPYCVHLGKNPQWTLSYIDDWMVVYLKNASENEKVLKREAYHFLTPERFEDRTWLDTLPVKDIPTVQAELSRSLTLCPESAKARLAIATLCLRTGDVERARQNVEDAARQYPEDPEVLEGVAAVAVRQARWLDAARAYEKMVRQAGSTFFVNFEYLASIFEKAGDVAKADSYRRKALATARPTALPTAAPSSAPLGAGDARSHNNQGIQYAGQGQLDNARAEFTKAFEMDPQYSEAYNNLGSTYFVAQHWDQAAQYYRKAIEKNPQFANAHFNLARTYGQMGLLPQARQEAQAAKDLGIDTQELLTEIEKRSGPK